MRVMRVLAVLVIAHNVEIQHEITPNPPYADCII